MKLRILSILSGILFLCFALPSFSWGEESVASYFPVTQGAEWKYKINYDGAIKASIVKMLPDEKNDGTLCKVMGVYIGTTPVPFQKIYYSVSDSSVKIVKNVWGEKSSEYSPAAIILPDKMLPGKKWNWEGTGPADVICFQSLIEKKETLNLLGKSYPCIKVVTHFYTNRDTTIYVRSWYAKNIGKVKEETEIIKEKSSGKKITITAELTEYHSNSAKKLPLN